MACFQIVISFSLFFFFIFLGEIFPKVCLGFGGAAVVVIVCLYLSLVKLPMKI